jgi:hypothetical protein
MSSTLVALTMILSSVCAAQQWEIGALGGFGFYQNTTLTNPAGSARAGFEPRLAIGAVFGQNMYRYISGEIRYMYLVGAPVIKSQGTEAITSGYTNLIHYDLIFHAAPNESRLRPYFAAGGGIKVYSGTGRRSLAQPLSEFAVLTPVDQVKPMVSVGAGVKYLLSGDVQLRVDFRTYLTPAPNILFRPTPPSTMHGWIYNFIPMVGISYVF